MFVKRVRQFLLLLMLLGLIAAGCSPESQRVRGGGMGADVGNRYLGPQVNMHGEIDPLFGEPVLGKAVETQP